MFRRGIALILCMVLCFSMMSEGLFVFAEELQGEEPQEFQEEVIPSEEKQVGDEVPQEPEPVIDDVVKGVGNDDGHSDEYFTVTYQDGCSDRVFIPQEYSGLEFGSDTPQFEGDLEREGYTFAGWYPEVSYTVEGDIIYTAIWDEEEIRSEEDEPETETVTITYKDGKDQTVFEDYVFEVEKYSSTPRIDIDIELEGGYVITGWTPEVSNYAYEDKVYTAIWYQKGDPYAVLDDEGALVYFRSEEEYEDKTEGVFTDIMGNTHEGVVFCIDDDLTPFEDWRIGDIVSISVAEGQIIKFSHGYLAFNNFKRMESFDGRGFDTSGMTSMGYMFSGCTSLTQVSLKGLDTSNVKSMFSMFNVCQSLQSVDMQGIDTSNVQDMIQMFTGCSSLKNLDLSSFDTGNVTSMASMFLGCKSLKSLDVSSFNTSRVTEMSSMFFGCEQLQAVDVSNFDTRRVTNMSQMFTDCKSLKNIDVSRFNTSAVVDLSSMFMNCNALTSLDVSNFDTSKVINMQQMFYGCKSLKSIDVSHFNTSRVTAMNSLFGWCNSLKSLDLSSFDTSNVVTMGGMFPSTESTLMEITLGPNFTVWTDNAKLPAGTWENKENGLKKSETALYENYSSHAESWSGVWELEHINVPNGSTVTVSGKYYMSYATYDSATEIIKIAIGTDQILKVTGLKPGMARATVYPISGGSKDLIFLVTPAVTKVVILGGQGTGSYEGEKVSGKTLSVEENTVQLSAYTEPSDVSDDVKWTSSDKTIATVNSKTGLVTRVKNGTVTITATATDGTGKKSSVSIKFVTFVKNLEITGKTDIAVGKTATLSATVNSDATTKTVIWKSSDTTIATVSSDGVVTGKKAGAVTITATAKDGSKVSAVHEMEIHPAVTAVVIRNEAGTVVTGKTKKYEADTVQLSASTNPDGAIQNVKWTSSDKTIATVGSTSGKVTRKKNGTVTITATAQDGTGVKATVKLNFVTFVKELEISGKTDIAVGRTATLKTTVNSDATTKTVSWKSSNTTIATVTSEGVVTGKAAGTVTITATAKDGSKVFAEHEINVHPAVTSVKIVEGDDLSAATVNGKTLKREADKLQLSAYTNPDGAIQAVKWTSSDKTIATIGSTSGKVTRKKNGTVTFTATAQDGTGKKATVTINFVTFVKDIEISGKTDIAVGKTATLKAAVTSDATTKTVSWKSSDKTIATVTSEGVVTGKGVGTVTITATAKDGSKVYAEHEINVHPAAKSVTILNEEGTDITGKTKKYEADKVQLSAIVDPDGSIQTVKWTSSDKTIATVTSKTGVVTRKKNGTVTITATAQDGTGVKATVKLNFVTFVKEIKITGSTTELALGKTLTLTATTNSDATTKTVTWSSSDKSVATVTSAGVVTAVSEGTAIITAKAKDGSGVTATYELKVCPAVKTLKITNANGDILSGKTTTVTGEKYLLYVIATPDGASDLVKWSSSDKTIATVNTKTGLVTRVKDGTVTITATAKDGSGKKCTATLKFAYDPSVVQDHIFGEWKVATAATCTEKGEEERYCLQCGEKETRETEALGHDYKTVVKEATCLEGGYTTFTCERCGDSYTSDETEALGHDFGEWIVTEEPTCTENGKETRICSRCDASEIQSVESLGHNYTVEITDPTCTEGGCTTHTCERCGDSYVTDETEALGHEYSEWEVTTEPTCIEQGDETRKCSRCDESESRAVPELGHDYIREKADSSHWLYTCSRCGDSYTEEMNELQACLVVSELGGEFSDSCNESMQDAAESFNIDYDLKLAETTDAIPSTVRKAAQDGYDLVVFPYTSAVSAFLGSEAEYYPDTTFVAVQCPDPYYVAPDNVIAIYFKDNEADFVGGAVAAKQSTTKATGWLGGVESTALHDFLIGWVEGVKYGDETATTAFSWVTGNSPWADPERGYYLAQALVNNYNIDVLHAIAGASGNGLIEFVKDERAEGNKSIWSIGIDNDLHSYYKAAGNDYMANAVFTSVVKKYGKPIYDIVEKMANGEPLTYGCIAVGISEEAVGVVENDYFSSNAVFDTIQLLNQIKADTLAGNITVDTAYGISIDELNAILRGKVLNYMGEDPGEQETDVTVGVDAAPNGDWAYGAFQSSNKTDQAVLNLTDDCKVVTSNKEGDYVINNSVVDSYSRSEDANGNVTYTFRIKQGLLFNNGEPITAQNFLAWTLFTASSAGQQAGVVNSNYDLIKGGADYHDGKTNVLSGLRLLGQYEFSQTILKSSGMTTYLPYYYELAYIKLQAINLDYWFGLSWSVRDDGEGAYLYNAEGHTLDNSAGTVQFARYDTSNRVTAGPYNLVSYDTETKEIVLAKNQYYAGDFQGQIPTLNSIKIVYVSDSISDAIANGTVNLVSSFAEGGEISSISELIDNGTINESVTSYPRAGYGYIQFVCDLGPTQYVEFRQAVAWLLDRDEYATRYTGGMGITVDGPYTPAFSMYKNSRSYLEEHLTHYTYNISKAVELLKSIGFVYNSDGTDYIDGSGELRYKEVTSEEAGYYETVEVDGKLLMPAKIKWAVSEENSVPALLKEMLIDSGICAEAGIEIEQNIMTFPEMLNYMYRHDAYGLGGDYSVPTFNMFNLVTGFGSGAYDFSYEFTTKSTLLEVGYNTTHLYDEELDSLSMNMVYSVEVGDYDTYLDLWKRFVVRYNDLLPRLPLYCNLYESVYPNTITGYEESPFWDYSRALLYATYTE